MSAPRNFHPITSTDSEKQASVATAVLPHILIVGGGFGGLAAARALQRAPAHIPLIDRNNHHLFQPLLYQVATSVLAPGQIAAPIREILRKQRNTTVILGEVTVWPKSCSHFRRWVWQHSLALVHVLYGGWASPAPV
jgi:NADPH-dependent 2,4-dienoyl-CoA reductase/sulfur reductase-like enzyme